jgi:hypothetical protein
VERAELEVNGNCDAHENEAVRSSGRLAMRSKKIPAQQKLDQEPTQATRSNKRAAQSATNKAKREELRVKREAEIANKKKIKEEIELAKKAVSVEKKVIKAKESEAQAKAEAKTEKGARLKREQEIRDLKALLKTQEQEMSQLKVTQIALYYLMTYFFSDKRRKRNRRHNRRRFKIVASSHFAKIVVIVVIR